jgi:UDP-glucuronate decarboxylase
VVSLTGSTAAVVHEPLPADDPSRRRPDISAARSALGWEPKIALNEGLAQTVEYFRRLVVATG